MLISEEYQQVLHKTREHLVWGTTGFKWADILRGFLRDEPYTDILDYGAGSGSLAKALPEYDVTEYDPGIPGKENGNHPRNFVVCLDVLEHIEPELLDNVLADLQRCVLDKGFFVIACVEANTILADGRNAHLIVEPYHWWKEKIEERFDIIQDACIGWRGTEGYKVLVRTKGVAS